MLSDPTSDADVKFKLLQCVAAYEDFTFIMILSVVNLALKLSVELLLINLPIILLIDRSERKKQTFLEGEVTSSHESSDQHSTFMTDKK